MAHFRTPHELVLIDGVFRLGSEAVLNRLEPMTEVVNDTWQSQRSCSGHCLHNEKARVHEAVVLDAIEHDLRHGNVLNVAFIIYIPLFFLENLVIEMV